MKLERFQELLDVLGGELSSWPSDERAAARRLLASDLRARAAFENAQALDGLIRRVLAAGPADETAACEAAERVLACLSAAPLPGQRGGGVWARVARVLADRTTFEGGLRHYWPRLTALACAGALGIAIGMAAPELFAPPEPGRYAVSTDGDPGSFVFDGEQDTGAVL